MADGQMNTHPDPATKARKVPAAAVELGGKHFMIDSKGLHVPLRLMRDTDLLEDEAVRDLVARAVEINALLAEFKELALGRIAGLLALLDQEYGVQPAGRKGNVTLNSFDGTKKVTLSIADLLVFGPELQSAKKLVDECLIEWTGAEGTRPEVQAIVQRAFNTDQEGKVNRAELFSLLRLEIEDPRWQRAMKAIRDSIRVMGTKEYVRLHERDDAAGMWRLITLDMASA